jgi:hypothetical protein
VPSAKGPRGCQGAGKKSQPVTPVVGGGGGSGAKKGQSQIYFFDTFLGGVFELPSLRGKTDIEINICRFLLEKVFDMDFL